MDCDVDCDVGLCRDQCTEKVELLCILGCDGDCDVGL